MSRRVVDRHTVEQRGASNLHYGTRRSTVERHKRLVERARNWHPPELAANDALNAEVLLCPEQIIDYLPGERDQRGFKDEAFTKICRAIEQYGQLRPVLVRPHADDAALFELVYGRRRVEACRRFGRAVRAYVEPMDDARLVAAMVQDNQEQATISQWERGRWIARLMDEHGYQTMQVTEMVGLSRQAVRQLGLLGRLPAVVIRLLKDPRQLTWRDGERLSQALQHAKTTGGDLARLELSWTSRMEAASTARPMPSARSARPRKASVRLLAATNRPPSSLKHDLVARFKLRLGVPGLNERREDVPLLVRHLLKSLAGRDAGVRARYFDGDEPRVEPALVCALSEHEYTTHVRELESLLLASMATSKNGWLALTRQVAERLAPARPSAGGEIGPAQIEAALDRAGGNVSVAWKYLGLSSRDALNRLIKKHGIVVRRG